MFIKVEETGKVYDDSVLNALPDFNPDTVKEVVVGDKKVRLSDIKTASAVDPNSFDTEIANLNSQITDVKTKAEADIIALQQHITDTQADKDAFNAQFPQIK